MWAGGNFHHRSSCSCPWCSGGRGGTGGGGRLHQCHPRGTTTNWADELNCCRKESCPTCGQDTFVVDHDYGRLRFSDLGPTWSWHPCFKETDTSTKFRELLTSDELWGRVVLVGTCVQTSVDESGAGRVTIRHGDGLDFKGGIITFTSLVGIAGEPFVVVANEWDFVRFYWGEKLTNLADGGVGSGFKLSSKIAEDVEEDVEDDAEEVAPSSADDGATP